MPWERASDTMKVKGMNMPPARVSVCSDKGSIEITVKKEDCGSQEHKYRLSQWTNERHCAEGASGGRDSRPYCQIGENNQRQYQESTDAHCPTKAHFRDQLNNHDRKDNAA